MNNFGISEFDTPKSNRMSKEQLDNCTSIKDFKKYEMNPYLDDLNVKTKTIYKKTRTFTTEQGKFVEGREIGTKETKSFVKIFNTDSYDARSLTASTCQLLIYILFNKLKYNDSILYLPIDEIQTQTGITSKETIYKSITQLLKEEFISKHKENNLYWINPDKIFKGDRQTLKL